MRGERWAQPREHTGRDVGKVLGDRLRGWCLGVPRGKVVRAGIAQLNSWALLRRWGGGRETDKRQRERGKKEKHTGTRLTEFLPCTTPFAVPAQGQSSSHVATRRRDTPCGSGEDPKAALCMLETCSDTCAVVKMNANFTLQPTVNVSSNIKRKVFPPNL